MCIIRLGTWCIIWTPPTRWQREAVHILTEPRSAPLFKLSLISTDFMQNFWEVQETSLLEGHTCNKGAAPVCELRSSGPLRFRTCNLVWSSLQHNSPLCKPLVEGRTISRALFLLLDALYRAENLPSLQTCATGHTRLRVHFLPAEGQHPDYTTPHCKTVWSRLQQNLVFHLVSKKQPYQNGRNFLSQHFGAQTKFQFAVEQANFCKITEIQRVEFVLQFATWNKPDHWPTSK